MVILERVRNFHDDIVYRHVPEIRELAPLVLSGVFLLALATMLATTLLGGSGTHWRSDPGARIDYQQTSTELGRSSVADRTAAGVKWDASFPKTPMRIDIERERGAVHSGADTIEVRGMPIDLGDWPRD